MCGGAGEGRACVPASADRVAVLRDRSPGAAAGVRVHECVCECVRGRTESVFKSASASGLVACRMVMVLKLPLSLLSHDAVFIFHRSNGKNMFSSSGTSVSGRKIKTAVRRRK